MNPDTFFLRNKGDIVGYAKYVLLGDAGPRTRIHRHSQSKFARKGENLVAIHGVQIFSEFEELEYQYHFQSFEDIPVFLGDLNNVENAFKQVDQNKIVSNPGHTLASLDISPRTVSVRSIGPVRDSLLPSPSKVHFSDSVLLRELNRTASLPVTRSRSPNVASDDGCEIEKRYEDSVEQFMGALDAEDEELTKRFDESVDQFEDELDEEEARGRSQNEDSSEPWKSSNKRKRRISGYLSPAERIRRKIKYRKPKKFLSAEHREQQNDIKHHEVTNLRTDRVLFGGSDGEGSVRGSADNDDNEVQAFTPNQGQHSSGAAGRPRFIAGGGRSSPSHSSPADLIGSPRSTGVPDILCLAPGSLTDMHVQKSLKKRQYRFNKRSKAGNKATSKREKKRLECLRNSFEDNPFESLKHCCREECYSVVNSEYALVQYRRFLGMKRPERKRALKSTYNRYEKRFWFDGNPVCSRFVVALSFSNQLQSSVKGTPKARGTASIAACPRDTRTETKKDKIILFLRNLAGAIGDSLPTRNHTNLPLLAKSQVYSRFLKISATPGESPVSMNYLYSV